MKIYAITNSKGGIAKTITTVNLAAAMAKKGKRVLVIDIDVQCNCGLSFGFRKDYLSTLPSVYDSMKNMEEYPLDKAIIKTSIENIDLLPSNNAMTTIEEELTGKSGRECLLIDAFDACRVELNSKYDYTLIDCPPISKILTDNALVLADAVIIPVSGKFSMDGIHDTYQKIKTLRRRLNRGLDILGIFYTLYRRTRQDNNNIDIMKQNYGDLAFNSVVRMDAQVEESIDAGTPIVINKPYSNASLDYISLAQEVIDRENR